MIEIFYVYMWAAALCFPVTASYCLLAREQNRSRKERLVTACVALNEISTYYIAETRRNDWVECCKLKETAKDALDSIRARA